MIAAHSSSSSSGDGSVSVGSLDTVPNEGEEHVVDRVGVWWPWCAEGDEGDAGVRTIRIPTGRAVSSTRPRWAREPDKQLSWRPGMGMKHAFGETRCGAWHMKAGTLPVDTEGIDE